MIKEIYIDNFMCLVNFRIAPSRLQLWLGNNGSGKSCVLDALLRIQRVLFGNQVQDLFDHHFRTVWSDKSNHEFNLRLDIDGEEYQYNLVIEFETHGGRCKIKRESLKWQGEPFYSFEESHAHLYRLNQNTNRPEEVTSLSVEGGRSLIPSIGELSDNRPLLRFREEVEKWLIVQPVPTHFSSVADHEARFLMQNAENFAQWFRHVTQENASIVFAAYKHLEEAVPGFVGLKLKQSGDSRRLTVAFRLQGKDREFGFSDLSDGQRQLIVLYVIVEAMRRGMLSTVFLDEPDNFVSLPEVRPIIGALQEVTEEGNGQAIVISHHPEIINELGHGDEIWFSRKDGSHTITTPYPTVPGLTPAEVMERGWDHE